MINSDLMALREIFNRLNKEVFETEEQIRGRVRLLAKDSQDRTDALVDMNQPLLSQLDKAKAQLRVYAKCDACKQALATDWSISLPKTCEQCSNESL